MTSICCPFQQETPSNVGANFTLDLGPVCNGIPSTNYGFTSYDLDFQIVAKSPLAVTYRINARNAQSTSLQFTTNICYFDGQPCPNSNVSNAVINVTTSGEVVTVRSIANASAGTKAGLTWTFPLSPGTVSSGLLCPGRSNLSSPIGTPSIPPGSSCVFIKGQVTGTRDGKQICESSFTVTSATSTKSYLFYCTPVSRVMRGTGCTLAEKAESLGFDPSSVGTYSMLRLFLSMFLFEEECLNVELLRQCYAAQFLRRVKRSTEFSCYASLFENDLYLAFQR